MIASVYICRFCGGRVIYDTRSGYGVCVECGSLTEDMMAYQHSYHDLVHSSPISRGARAASAEDDIANYEEYVEDIVNAIRKISNMFGVPADEIWMLASKYTELWSGRQSRTIAEVFMLAYCIISSNYRCVESIKLAYPQRFSKLMKLASYVAKKEGHQVETRGAGDPAARGAKGI